MSNENTATPNVNEHGELQITQKPGERPHLLMDQGFSLLRYSDTDQENFDEVELFDEHIAPLVEVIAGLCNEIGIPCYMVFTPGHTTKGAEMRDLLVSGGVERLTKPVLMAAAAVRCDVEQAMCAGDAIDMRMERYMASLEQAEAAEGSGDDPTSH